MDLYWDVTCKILILGDQKVGKTSLIAKYCDNIFDDEGNIQIDFRNKHLYYREKIIKLDIINTSGIGIGKKNNKILDLDNLLKNKDKDKDKDKKDNDKKRKTQEEITKNIYKKTLIYVILYDISNKNTFDSISYWLSEIETYKSPEYSSKIFLVGNQFSNKKRKVTYEEAEQSAIDNNMYFFEINIKTGEGIEALFSKGIDECVKCLEQKYNKSFENIVDNSKKKINKPICAIL